MSENFARNKIDGDILARCLKQEPYGWQDFVDRFMSPLLFVIEETARQRGRVLPAHEKTRFCEAVFRALRYNHFQLLREFEGNAALSTYLMILTRRLCVAFLRTA